MARPDMSREPSTGLCYVIVKNRYLDMGLHSYEVVLDRTE